MDNTETLILNLGCGDRISSMCINIDWAVHLRLARNRALLLLAKPFLTEPRRRYMDKLSKNILVHDLRKGIPFADGTVDAVYHSHILEHIDRESVEEFQREVYRVLKKGGVQRICVPDLKVLAEDYLESFRKCQNSNNLSEDHDRHVSEILEQCVRRQAFGSSNQPPIRRFVENLFLGDARKRGETHQWMYDAVNLGAILSNCGYRDIRELRNNDSHIPNWQKMGLEVNPDGTEYKPKSLYLEAIK